MGRRSPPGACGWFAHARGHPDVAELRDPGDPGWPPRVPKLVQVEFQYL